jgi:hypothetical protein
MYEEQFYSAREGVKVGSNVGTILGIAQGANFGVTPLYMVLLQLVVIKLINLSVAGVPKASNFNVFSMV